MPLLARLQRAAFLMFSVASVAACAGSNGTGLAPDGINDPREAQNRKVHAFNKNLDRNVVRPVALGYAKVVPDGVEDSVSNFATNLGQPSVMVNSLLQGDLRGLGLSTLRFTLNSTAGVLGLFDPATAMTVAQHDTDFGETLFVWGVGEGAYQELPVFGAFDRTPHDWARCRPFHQPVVLRSGQPGIVPWNRCIRRLWSKCAGQVLRYSGLNPV